MKRIIYILFLFIAITSCEEKKRKKVDPLSHFNSYDKGLLTTKSFTPRKKQAIPFEHNNIYDPFAKNNSLQAIQKSSYNYKKGGTPIIKLLNKTESTIDVSKRHKLSDLRKAYPIIIENDHKKDTLYIKLFRGKAIITQESFNKKKDRWIPMEYLTKERMGFYYYKISPKEYIYTKIPVYQGAVKRKIRVKVSLNDSSSIYLPEFNGSIPRQISK